MSEDKRGIQWCIIAPVGIILFAVLAIAFVTLNGSGRYRAPKNSLIVHAINVSRTVMNDIYGSDGNYNNFDCTHEDMIEWCEEIDENYGQQDGKEPIIVYDTVDNSQAACIYSPLNVENRWFRKKSLWYCADSEGYAGYTSLDPGSKGYCVEGESAKCPPVSEVVP